MKLIGLTGYAGSGKSTVADFLADRGYEVHAFADPLREALLALNPVLPRYVPSEGRLMRLQELVATAGWDAAKRDPLVGQEVRRLMQAMGDAMRAQHGADVFVRLMERRTNGLDRVVIPDARYTNEAEWIRERCGIVVKVHRPGVDRLNEHSSEDGLPRHLVDNVIVNDSTLRQLQERTARLVSLPLQDAIDRRP